MNNLSKTICICTMLILAICACKKKKDDTPAETTPAGKKNDLLVISNPALANTSNALQSVFTSSNGTVKAYCFGSFASNGKPDMIKQMIIHKTDGDTSLNIFFDPLMRVKTVFVSVKGINQSALLTCEYTPEKKVVLNSFFYNFSNDSSNLSEQVIVADNGNGSYTFDGHTTYRTADISQVADSTDNFMSSYAMANANIVVFNAVVFVATTALGCKIGAFWGCVAGGALGLYLAMKPAGASEIRNVTSATGPLSPSGQLGASPGSLKLLLTNIFYSSINTCQRGSKTGSPNTMSFYVFDPDNILTSNNWTLKEQIGKQAEFSISSPSKTGDIISFTGCIWFDSDESIPGRYYLKLKDNSVVSNPVTINFYRPPGAN